VLCFDLTNTALSDEHLNWEILVEPTRVDKEYWLRRGENDKLKRGSGVPSDLQFQHCFVEPVRMADSA
jgi:hypothetical protein